MMMQQKESFTHEGDHEDPEEDPEGVTEDVHEDNGDQGDTKIALTLSSLTLSSTQNLEKKYRIYIKGFGRGWIN